MEGRGNLVILIPESLPDFLIWFFHALGVEVGVGKRLRASVRNFSCFSNFLPGCSWEHTVACGWDASSVHPPHQSAVPPTFSSEGLQKHMETPRMQYVRKKNLGS